MYFVILLTLNLILSPGNPPSHPRFPPTIERERYEWQLRGVSIIDAKFYSANFNHAIFLKNVSRPQGWFTLSYRDDVRVVMQYIEYQIGVASIHSFICDPHEVEGIQKAFEFIKNSQYMSIDWQNIAHRWKHCAFYYLGESKDND